MCAKMPQMPCMCMYAIEMPVSSFFSSFLPSFLSPLQKEARGEEGKMRGIGMVSPCLPCLLKKLLLSGEVIGINKF